MLIALGTDHAGFPLRGPLLEVVRSGGHRIVDCGAMEVLPNDDYPDYAKAVAEAVVRGHAERGLILCGSGVGASVAANKFIGIRAALCHDTFAARQGVEDDAMNVLCIGARIIGPALAGEIVQAFLRASFSGEERHRRRLAKIEEFERQLAR